MNNQIKLFTNEIFGNVRAININGKAWFVGEDVVEDLGYNLEGNSYTKYINRYVDEDDALLYDSKTQVQIGLQFDYKELGQRGGYLVNEYGVIELVMQSPLPQAKEFKHWVTHEIIPSVLETGEYSIKKESYMIEDPIERAKAWIKEQEEKRALELVAEEQQKVIEKQEHKINEQNDSIRNLLDISDLPYETIRQRIYEFMSPRHSAYSALYKEFDLRYRVRSGQKFYSYKEDFLERYERKEVKKKDMINSQLAYICDEMEMAEELYLVMQDIFHDDFLQFLRSKIDTLTFGEVA